MATTAEAKELQQLEQEIAELEREEAEQRKQARINRQKQARSRRKKAGLGIEAFKLVAFICAVVLFVTFVIQDGAYDDFLVGMNFGYSDPSTSQGAFVQSFMSYENSVVGGNASAPREIDTSGWYVDANHLTQTQATEVAQGVFVSMNGPNIPVTDTAYILNMAKPYELIYSELIQVEKDYGSTYDYKEASEYAQEQLRVKNVFGYQSNNKNKLCGSVAPAIMTRDWFDMFDQKPYATGDMWTSHGSTWHGSSNSGYWDPVNINLMFVKPDDYARYQAGETVDIYYVNFQVIDAKAHNAPWGFNQTYCELGSNGVAGAMSYQGPNNDWSRNGTVTQTDGDTTYTMLKKLWDSASSNSVKPYYWAHIAPSPIQYTATVGGVPNDAYSAFEYMSRDAYNAVVSWAQTVSGGDTMYCVGVFCSEYNPVT